jgi:hypothetical protein
MQMVRDGERSGTLNGHERQGTFEPERSNALERIAESVYVHASKTKELLYLYLFLQDILVRPIKKIASNNFKIASYSVKLTRLSQ